MMVLKGMLVIGSLTGYCFLAKEKTKIRTEFIPLTVFSAVSLILYLGGLAGQLLPTAAAVYGIGILLCLYLAFRIRKNGFSVKEIGLFEISFLLIGILFLVLSFFLKMQHYDNFSHWAVIVKNMLTTNHFPTVQDELIVFKDYPPGTSVFIYYVCRFWGNSQGMMLMAQNALLLAGFFAIFGMIREKRRFLVYSFVAMGFAMVSFLNLTIRINNLLVDFHLPVFALAAVAMIDYYQKDLKKAALLLVPVLGFLTIVKNTGLIFAAFPLLYLVYVIIKYKITWKKLGCLVVILGLVAVPYLLWNFHMDHQLAGIEQKFSAESQSEEYAPADTSQQKEIAEKFIQQAVNLSSRAAIAFAFCHGAVLVLALFLLMRRRKWLRLFTTLIVLDAAVLCYYGGILYLYLYRMPASEAVVLAGFERYACSIMVFFVGGLILAAAKDIEGAFWVKQVQGDTYRAFQSPVTKRRYQSAVFVTSVILFNFLYSEMTGLLEVRMHYPESIAGQVETLVGDHWYGNGKEDTSRYLVIGSDEDGKIANYELSYTMKYFLYASQVDTMAPMPLEELEGLLEDYDKVILFDSGVIYGQQEVVEMVSRKAIWDSEALKEELAKAEQDAL